MPNLVGTGLNQVPTNSMLGGLAYQSPDHASIKDLDLKNLSQINSEIADTATDVFVYDTRKDSDGGAWRKRTQNTSWYNETLGTATRGTRKEFPAVAVITVIGGTVSSFGTDNGNMKIKIYDGDDPDLPLWMMFEGFSDTNNILRGGTNYPLTGVYALNGTMCFTRDGGYGMGLVSFIDEKIYSYWDASSNAVYNGNVQERNSAKSAYTQSGNGLVSATTNDIAMTVLPNAPVDSATGLPIPTIAVATDGGMSIIKDDGTVADFSGFAPVTTVHIDADNVIGTSNSGSPSHDFIFKTHIPGGDEAFTDGITAGSKNYYMNSSSGTIPLLRDLDMSDSTYDSKDDVVYRGGNAGFDIIRAGVNYSQTHSNPAIAYIASDYNTGYMPGNIKGAFLSDTDATNVTGTELWPEGDFADASEWSSAGAEWTISGGTATVSDGNGGYSFLGSSSGTLTNGKKYILSFTVSNYSGGRLEASQASSTNIQIPFSANGSYAQLINYTGTTGSGLGMYGYGGGAVGFTLDNLYLRKLEEEDRSVNNTGLAVYGTITKSAVATGANLVGYSGFSASNHLLQPNNSDLQFGTGDLHMIFWHKKTDDSANEVLFQALDSTTGANGAALAMQHLSGNYYAYTTGGTGGPGGTNDFLTGAFVTDGNWHCVAAVRSSGTLTIYVDGRNVGSGVRNYDVDNTGDLYIGSYSTAGTATAQTSTMALLRIGGSAPSPEQIKKIYEDEKCLFHENAQATLYGSSDAVTALAYDDTTELLHVGTSAGRSEFQGLRRINNTTTAVTTAISASNDLVAEQ